MRALEQTDPAVAAVIHREEDRLRLGLEIIASENLTSAAVLEAVGSVLTNKYAEGYPGKRYYGGCQFADEVEELARSRARELFGAEHANVQPHSGAEANMATYFALMNVGDTAMGMNLSDGGHLTHGLEVNFSARLYNFVHYGVDRESELIDYDRMRETAKKERPKVIIAGATTYSRIINFEVCREIADEVDAYLVADIAHIAGLVAAGVHPSPVPHAHVVTSTAGKAVCFGEAMKPEFVEYQKRIIENADALANELQAQGWRIVSGGTDNHLVLVDVGARGLSGSRAQKALDAVGIFANKNTIPFDERPPYVGSGLRLGSPGLTTRGMGPEQMRAIARIISRVLEDREDEKVQTEARRGVRELAEAYPVPGITDRTVVGA
jgi:glycine hydroxymethyltransferase